MHGDNNGHGFNSEFALWHWKELKRQNQPWRLIAENDVTTGSVYANKPMIPWSECQMSAHDGPYKDFSHTRVPFNATVINIRSVMKIISSSFAMKFQ